jgi:mRNA interferase MazF
MDFDPQAGHEQGGHRPALVVSPMSYNRLRGMMLCCPMTSRSKGYAFEVLVDIDPLSVVLADQIKCQDWRARGARFKGRVSETVMIQVRGMLRRLIDPAN